MQRIRRATKKHRMLLIVIVALLAVGLVGSFAVWNTDNYDRGNDSDKTLTEQIAYYEQLIVDKEPEEGIDVDYDTASTLSNLYMQLLRMYGQASADVAAEDAEAAMAYKNSSMEAATKAANYYQIQLDKAPDTLNDYARAQILGNKALVISYIGMDDEAQLLYDEALTLAPENFEVANKYLDFLYWTQGFEAAQNYGDSFKSLVGEESELYEQMEQVIAQHKLLEELYNINQDESVESDANDEAENSVDEGSEDEVQN